MAKTKHTIRIISGTHRSRRLPVLNYTGLRPTGDRVRETLFNWLQQDIAKKNILDLCAGSGALGFEAASRGAKSVILLEKNKVIAQQLYDTQQKFIFPNVQIITTSCQQYLRNCQQKLDLVFIDPPFADNLMQELSELVIPVMNVGGFIYREVAKDTELQNLPINWQLYRQKVLGKVKIELWQKGT
ncbi:MAG: 16S rRNA (guanine(966)-N(2))-methyltransferase RsmD [Proteobacteria bacterium]|nr:16S rRNA (guanine(966)-N(2))-methyltransferase RsmD [Pseudomonadota bacterium]